jgi:hypothetical protein
MNPPLHPFIRLITGVEHGGVARISPNGKLVLIRDDASIR